MFSPSKGLDKKGLTAYGTLMKKVKPSTKSTSSKSVVDEEAPMLPSKEQATELISIAMEASNATAALDMAKEQVKKLRVRNLRGNFTGRGRN